LAFLKKMKKDYAGPPAKKTKNQTKTADNVLNIGCFVTKKLYV